MSKPGLVLSEMLILDILDVVYINLALNVYPNNKPKHKFILIKFMCAQIQSDSVGTFPEVATGEKSKN